eukprot:jgi/Ulvmu1/8287/UM041_0099.1
MLIGSFVSHWQAKAAVLGCQWAGASFLGKFKRPLPFLIRTLWRPVRPNFEHGDSGGDYVHLRQQLRHSMQLYEASVNGVAQHSTATIDDLISSITNLVHHGEGNTQFDQAAAARGLHIAVASLVEVPARLGLAEGSYEKTMANLHMAQELVYSCLAYYIPDSESAEPVPLLNVGDCRHSTSIITQALSQHDPAAVVPMLRTMTNVAGDKARVGSVTATAMVRACLRSRFQGMTSKISNLPRAAGRRKTQLDRRFHAMLKLSKSLDRHQHPPPCLFQALVTSAIATDLYHWNRMRVAHAEKQAKRWARPRQHVSLQPPKRSVTGIPASVKGGETRVHKNLEATAWLGAVPVAFLLAHDDSHTHRVLSMRGASLKQCISDRLAIELLGLSRSEDDVTQILHKLIFPNAAKKPLAWVDRASEAVTCAAVKQFVISQAWSHALQVVKQAIAAEIQGHEDQGVVHATIEDPFSLLRLSDATPRLHWKRSAAMATNALLCGLANIVARPTCHAPTQTQMVYTKIDYAIRLSQVHGIPLSSHTVKQVFMCALYKKHADGRVNASNVRDACLASDGNNLSWSTAAHALLLVGDDGRHALSMLGAVCTYSNAPWSASGTAAAAKCSVATAFAVLRAPGIGLEDRLQRLRHLLSIVPDTEMECFQLRERLSRAAVAGFFQHASSMQDLSKHGLLQLLLQLMGGGLPFTAHLQKSLARHKHVLAVALVRHGVPDAAAMELKFAMERLAVGDVHFAGSHAGRRCISRVAAVRGRTAHAMCRRNSADDTPYCTDGYVTSTGFALCPAAPEEVIADCQQAAASWLPPAGGDIGGLCRQPYQDMWPSPMTAELLSGTSPASLANVDWMRRAEGAHSSPRTDLLLPLGEEWYLQQALQLTPLQMQKALHAVSTAFRLIHAVPPE